jgi:ATP-dependent DNA helicase PIF1
MREETIMKLAKVTNPPLGTLALTGGWADYEEMADEVFTPEKRFRAAASAGRNCFLTGMGGTGKTTVLKEFIAQSPRRVDVTAPTGVAALNAGGMTVHRFCGMMLGPQPGQSNEEYFECLRTAKNGGRSIQAGFNRVRRCELLVIDEISMLPGRQLDFIEFLFRRLRGSNEPFGGCQVVVVGDFLQLPPVRTLACGPHRTLACGPHRPHPGPLPQGEGEHLLPYDWAFASAAWEAAEFKTIMLEKVRRQDEPEFVRALGDFRRGYVWGESARVLQSRVRSNPPAAMPRLFTHNVQVDKWNGFQLSELTGDEVVLEAEVSGPDHQREFLTKNLLTPATLRLKPGALVMFTINKNEPGRREPLFVNGQVGVVQETHGTNGANGTDAVLVRTPSGEAIPVERFTWRYDAREEGSASFSQFPLRLAWAMTIHKAQGLTLDSAFLDIRAAREPGQAYVAVSRVRTLAGLQFKEWPKGIHVSPEAIRFYEGVM